MASISFEAAMMTVVEAELQSMDKEDQQLSMQIEDLQKEIQRLRTRQEDVVFRRGALSRFVTSTSASKCGKILEEMGFNQVTLGVPVPIPTVEETAQVLEAV